MNANVMLQKLIDVPTSDPDDSRRRKLLNIILIGILVLSVLTLVATFLADQFELIRNVDQGIGFAYVSGFSLLLGSILFYTANHFEKIPGWISSGLFLVFMMVVISFTDTAAELADGRSLFVFSIPIVASSVLLTPSSSFIFATFVALQISVLAYIARIQPNIIAMAGFYLLALVSWLSSRSLEQALKDLRRINANLDELVSIKTRELSNALARELALAGRTQAVLESIADGVVVFDLHGAAIQSNPALYKLLDIPFEKANNYSINDLTQSNALDARTKGKLAGILTRPGYHTHSHRIKWGQKTLSVSSARVLDSMGSEIGTVAVFRDFTREAELERMKSTFVAMISHELRTPLSAILGFSEMLKEGVYGPVNDKQFSISDRIMTNTRRLLNLINDLLDQAQMEAGKLTIKKEKVSPADLLENLRGVMDKIITDKGLTLITDLDDELPQTLIGDNARLQQILVNLVSNAVKFTDQGSITVKMSYVTETLWKVEVTDTGRGIPADEVPNIFEAFKQVEGAMTRVHGGFGLGLTIVKQLANLMGGEISVTSWEGVGSTFIVILPLTLPKG